MKRILATIGIAAVILLLARHNGNLLQTEADEEPPVITSRDADAPIWRAEVVTDDISSGLQRVSQQTFMGRPCQEDCAAYLAGYRWAESEGIDDPETCAGAGEFRDGCIIFAEAERAYNR